MIIVAVCATVVLVAQSAALVFVVRTLIDSRERSDESQARERATLADRVQQPDRIPVIPMPEFLLPEQDDDDLNLVGAILTDEKDDA